MGLAPLIVLWNWAPYHDYPNQKRVVLSEWLQYFIGRVGNEYQEKSLGTSNDFFMWYWDAIGPIHLVILGCCIIAFCIFADYRSRLRPDFVVPLLSLVILHGVFLHQIGLLFPEYLYPVLPMLIIVITAGILAVNTHWVQGLMFILLIVAAIWAQPKMPVSSKEWDGSQCNSIHIYGSNSIKTLQHSVASIKSRFDAAKDKHDRHLLIEEMTHSGDFMVSSIFPFILASYGEKNAAFPGTRLPYDEFQDYDVLWFSSHATSNTVCNMIKDEESFEEYVLLNLALFRSFRTNYQTISSHAENPTEFLQCMEQAMPTRIIEHDLMQEKTHALRCVESHARTFLAMFQVYVRRQWQVLKNDFKVAADKPPFCILYKTSHSYPKQLIPEIAE